MAKKENKATPFTITDTETNEVLYTLDFDRDSIRNAERNGFRLSRLEEITMTGVEDLWYFAFYKNHPTVTREKALEVLYDGLGGMPEGVTDRLVDLYTDAFTSLVQKSKNARMTVKL